MSELAKGERVGEGGAGRRRGSESARASELANGSELAKEERIGEGRASRERVSDLAKGEQS